VILGHHPHQPQGIEVYRNGVIFYSIGNFSFPPRNKKKKPAVCLPLGDYTHKEVYSVEPDPGFVFDIHRHFHEGGIVFVEADRLGLRRVSYLPTYMNEAGQPEVVRPADPQFEKSLTYLNWAGKFIPGGATRMQAADGRYQVYVRP
jgi:poly-gamma-glutamate synthesis protein (capsule biosynthesis protein)